MKRLIPILTALLCCGELWAGELYLRFKLLEPKDASYYLKLAGYIHKPPWYLPGLRYPQKEKASFKSGIFTPWLHYSKEAGDRLHGRMNRAGGIAEFPNLTVDIVTAEKFESYSLQVELATAPDEAAVRKRFEERCKGSLTSFLISPDLAADAGALESAGEMSERRLRWARDATGGKRVSPEHHIIQTSLWAAQRPELNQKEAEVLWLLGFNVLGNQHPPIPEHYTFRRPGHTHHVDFGPGATREEIDHLVKNQVEPRRGQYDAGVPFGFSDEIAARPRIGELVQAQKHFHQWLAGQRIAPAALGVSRIEEVVPIETPAVLRERMKENEAAARRIFYYTSRFRQLAGTERIRWHTEAFHRYDPHGALTSALVADHPYFAGTGLGMGMKPDTAWGNHALALDWFDLARRNAVDLIGIEDWMGLQYMYGPNYTWEGFQLMGFQAAIMRSGSRGKLPIIAWITPSDETNLRLKSASALCQGAKHFFYWTYGPTCTSTENYWSDLPGAYKGVAAITRQLAQCGDTIVKGHLPKTRVALLYSISSDLWQPFDYLHMLERRCTYLSLVHDQYLVDMLTEEDIEAGRLADYDLLYVTDPCIRTDATGRIARWVKEGGWLYASGAAGSRNEFGEEVAGLSEVCGIKQGVQVTVQPGRYRVRAALNAIPHLDEMAGFGVIGMKVAATPGVGKVKHRFKDGGPAVIESRYGKGRVRYVCATPGISYAKDARFVARELKEKWPNAQRRFINAWARDRGVEKPVSLSHPVIEAGLFQTDSSAALVLANFTYQPVDKLEVALQMPFVPARVVSCEQGELRFRMEEQTLRFDLKLGLNDIVLMHQK